MAEQTFRSPGFFEQEIELIAGAAGPVGTPAGVIGPSTKGPAFVPVTVANFTDFQTRFGGLDPEIQGPYAVNEWLKNKGALTYVRVLGAGANKDLADIDTTIAQGTVKNAGFKIASHDVGSYSEASVQFITAKHFISASSPSQEQGWPMFSDNPSFGVAHVGADSVNLVRAVIFAASGSRVQIFNYNESYSPTADDKAFLGPEDGSTTSLKFKIAISSSDASYQSTVITDGQAGVKILTASLDPRDEAYLAKVLNTDPDLFSEKKHLLYLDFAVDKELAPASAGGAGSETVAVLSGSGAFLDKFGRYDTRYTTPRTSAFISQPFGKFEYDLFHFESISDGAWSNDKIKVSIANIIASTDKTNPYGTFDVLVREFGDDDIDPKTIERYSKCSLDPNSDNYVAKMVGDKKVYYNHDADVSAERRLVISGKYPNRSQRVRIVMNSALEAGEVPSEALPFGFRGIPVLKTNDSLYDGTGDLTFDGLTFSSGDRLVGKGVTSGLTGSLLPPLPLRFKVTRGEVSSTDFNVGAPGPNERADARFFWGVVGTSVPSTGSLTNAILNSNAGTLDNSLVSAYTKFQGITKQDVLVTGSAADVFNANKFTLARVAFSNTSFTDVTGTAEAHMRESAYIRNGLPNGTDYRIPYGASSRVTLGTLIASSSVIFNRFTNYAKFTNVFYGGFDGLNILDRDNRKMNDRASSAETSGNGNGKALGYIEAGLTVNAAGEGTENNIVSSYRSAVDIMTDAFSSNVNILAIPGIREPLVTNYSSDKVRDYSLALYLQDIASYDDNGNRVWDDTSNRPSIRYTTETFVGRNIDNNYAATYFPDVFIEDPSNFRRVKVAPSIAALGAIGFNDKVSYPWFAPAGFNRAALDFVTNVHVRLNNGDRDVLQDARINPIATFPNTGYVIFGQKTLQLAKSALDRVNVRRLLLEVKRIVADIANRQLLFEQNTVATRQKFVNSVIPQLALIQAQSGIERFRVVMDETNNTTADADANRVNGRIVIVPTRVIEFIAIDFIITNAGVEFV
jgi:hypothetical protein